MGMRKEGDAKVVNSVEVLADNVVVIDGKKYDILTSALVLRDPENPKFETGGDKIFCVFTGETRHIPIILHAGTDSLRHHFAEGLAEMLVDDILHGNDDRKNDPTVN